jgi:hypothetical protein
MEPTARHQCLIYQGAPSLHLPALAHATRDKLGENYRCLYLNTRPMVAGMQSYLAAAGVDVVHEINKGSLVLVSEQQHLVHGRFDVDRMLHTLETTFQQALSDGYAGLWATGDMGWEMGPEKDFSKLLEYEQRLETFLDANPEMGGICQYHAETLPQDVVRSALLVHPMLFINETLSLLNAHYVHRENSLNALQEAH